MKDTLSPRTFRAISQLKGWLDSLKIKHKVLSPDTFEVTKSDNAPLVVKVTSEVTDPAIRSITVESMTDGLDNALQAFYSLMEDLGYPPTCPVARGPKRQKPVRAKDDFDLVVLRHQEFRKVPNPDPKKFQKYMHVINGVTNSFFKHNWGLCQRRYLEVDDLKTYAMVWTCNFIGLGERPLEDDRNDQNLHYHLHQRFSGLRHYLLKHELSIAPDVETANLGQFGELGRYENGKMMSEPVTLPRAWLEDEEETEHKKVARGTLDIALSKLPREVMLQKLREVASGDHFDPIARREAQKRLNLALKEQQPSI